GFGGAGGTRVRVEDLFGSEGVADLGDLFSIFTGGRGGARAGAAARQARGADLETEVRISFEDSMTGIDVPVKIRGPAPCRTCGGSGAEPGTSPAICPDCAGTGQVSVNQGFFSVAQTC